MRLRQNHIKMYKKKMIFHILPLLFLHYKKFKFKSIRIEAAKLVRGRPGYTYSTRYKVK